MKAIDFNVIQIYCCCCRATSKNSINSEHFVPRSDSSDVEEPVHFTSTVTSSTRGPGGVGSYLVFLKTFLLFLD